MLCDSTVCEQLWSGLALLWIQILSLDGHGFLDRRESQGPALPISQKWDSNLACARTCLLAKPSGKKT